MWVGVHMGVCVCAQVEVEEARIPGNIRQLWTANTHARRKPQSLCKWASPWNPSLLHTFTLHVSLNTLYSADFTVQDCEIHTARFSPTCCLYPSMLSVLDNWLSDIPPKKSKYKIKDKTCCRTTQWDIKLRGKSHFQ